MQKRQNPDRTRGTNLIALFAKLFFSGLKYSLTELAGHLGCSKQTVLSMITELQGQNWIAIDTELRGGRRYYWARNNKPTMRRMALTEEEMEVLLMCRAFTGHLLGREQFDAALSAVGKSKQLLGNSDASGDLEAPFGIYRPGAIDYTPHEKHWHTLLQALEKCLVCEITYRKIGQKKPKKSRIKPLKVFSYRESIYVHARYAKMPGELFKPAPYDPLLALHRIESVEMTDTPFKRPGDYDFEHVFNRHFGIMKTGKFKVKAELWGWAAGFMAERRLSPDQKITPKRGGRMIFQFSATSEPEVISWVLSMGAEIKLLEPAGLVDKLKAQLEEVAQLY